MLSIASGREFESSSHGGCGWVSLPVLLTVSATVVFDPVFLPLRLSLVRIK